MQTPSDQTNAESKIKNSEVAVRRSSRLIKPKVLSDYVIYCAVSNSNVPSTVEEALNGSDRAKWLEAMQEEYDAMIENKVWTLVKITDKQKPVKCKWVFQIKIDANGQKRYKARLVAKGFTQIHGVNYDETFSPVIRHSSLRMLMTIAVNKNLNIDHINVTSAFLNSTLDEEVFMTQPEGFEKDNNKIC